MAENYIDISEGSGKKVSTQAMTIGGQTVHIERSMMGIGVVDLPTAQIDAEDTPGTYPVAAIDLQGRYYIILKSTFDAADSIVGSFRFLFYDAGDEVIGYSDELSIDNSGESDGGSPARYYGIPIVFANVFCAKSFKIKLTDITGDVTISAGVC
jgi:hypothetical protein